MISVDTLSQASMFKGLPEAFLKEVAALGREVAFKKGEFVFREGDTADSLHILMSGSLALRVKLTSRPDSVTVSFVSAPHQAFGWSGIVSPHHYTSTAECEEDTSVLVIPAEPFMKLLEKEPTAGFIVMRRVAELIADRLRNSRQALLKTL